MASEKKRSLQGPTRVIGKAPPGSYWVVLDRAKCSLCEMCAYKCPTGALSLKRAQDIEQLLFTARRCNACDGDVLCETHCPEEAVQVVQREEGSPVLEDEKVLMDSPMAACLACGTYYMPSLKLETLLRQAKVEEKEIQRYCPDCRRKRLVENYPVPDE